MNNKDIYKIWAPFDKTWVDWVRPVPFVAIDNPAAFIPTKTIYPAITKMENTAIIVDLPGTQSVEAGIWLATQFGYRPIPIYNGVQPQKGARATSDNHSILGALVWGASILSEVKLNDDAPPAFLTDSNRLQRYKSDFSVFDNSWDVYHQDLPTEDFLLQHGIHNILIISNKYAKDLKRIFREHPKKKLSIYITDGYDEIKCIRKGR